MTTTEADGASAEVLIEAFESAVSTWVGRPDASAADYDRVIETRGDLIRRIASLEARVEELREALEKIASYDPAEEGDGVVDEWEEAAGFEECQRIARTALRQPQEGE